MARLLSAVVSPVKGTEIRELVAAALGYGLDVVNLPAKAKLAIGLPVVVPANPCRALVLPPGVGVDADDDAPLLPDSNDCVCGNRHCRAARAISFRPFEAFGRFSGHLSIPGEGIHEGTGTLSAISAPLKYRQSVG